MLLAQTFIYHFNYFFHELVLIQKLLYHFCFSTPLVRQHKLLFLGLVPEMDAFERHFGLAALAIEGKTDVVIDPTVVFRHALFDAFLKCTDSGAYVLGLFFTLFERIALYYILTVQIQEASILRVLKVLVL